MNEDISSQAREILETNGITDPAPARRLRVTPLSAIRLRATYWVWEDRIPVGGLTLWAGREGIGKSTSAAWLAAQVTRGTLPGVHHGRPRSVFYAASEDSWERTVAPRLVAAGADLERTFRIDVTEDERPGIAMPLTLPSDTSSLGREMKEYDVGLLVVDPLVSALNGSIDTHRDREVRSALEPLGAVADQAGAAVLGLVHFGKGASTDPLSLILGSRAFAATARAVIAMARDPEAEDGTVVLSQEKNNLGRLDLPSLTYVVANAEVMTEDGVSFVGRVEFTGQSERSVSDMLADGNAPGERGERDEAVAWLVDYLTDQGGEASAGDVIKAAEKDGFAKHTIQRARAKAGVKSQKSGFGKGWVWVLSPGGATTPAPGPRSGRSAEDDAKTTKNTAQRVLSPSSSSVSPSPGGPPDHRAGWWLYTAPTAAGKCPDCDARAQLYRLPFPGTHTGFCADCLAPKLLGHGRLSGTFKCAGCGKPMDATHGQAGEVTHPDCNTRP
jgi:hypothetical protein